MSDISWYWNMLESVIEAMDTDLIEFMRERLPEEYQDCQMIVRHSNYVRHMLTKIDECFYPPENTQVSAYLHPNQRLIIILLEM